MHRNTHMHHKSLINHSRSRSGSSSSSSSSSSKAATAAAAAKPRVRDTSEPALNGPETVPEWIITMLEESLQQATTYTLSQC